MDVGKQIILNENAQMLLNTLIKEIGIKNYVLKITPGSIRGDNYLGVIAKVCVKSGNSSWHWIVKCAPETAQFRSFIPIPSVYGREIYIYETILPEYQKFQDKKGIENRFCSYAKYYASSMIEPHETIILRDMKEMGYKLYNRQIPLDYNHVKLVMREYGRLHALSFALRDQKPDLFKEFENNIPQIIYTDTMLANENMRKHIVSQCDKVLECLCKVTNNTVYNKFINFRDHCFDLIQKALDPNTAGRYATILHGDCWMNNLLFKYLNSSASPSSMCFIDWQLSHVGSPVLDLSYFLFSCTDQELRDEHFNDIIKEYYDSFSSFLMELGSDPEKLFPYHILKEHLQIFSVFGLFMAIQILYFMVSDPDEIPDIHNFENEEDAMEKMNYVPKNLNKYNSRIKGVLLDFDKFNYEF